MGHNSHAWNLNWSISISYWIIKCLYLTVHYTYSQLRFTQNLPCTTTTEFFSLSTVNDAEASSKCQHRLISELSLIKVKCPPSPITPISSRYWLSLPHKLALVSKFVWLSYTQCIQKIKITYFTLYCLFEGGGGVNVYIIIALGGFFGEEEGIITLVDYKC